MQKSQGLIWLQDRLRSFNVVAIILFLSGSGILVWGLLLLWTRLTAVVASEAFINGKIISTHTPIAGYVEKPASLVAGISINQEQALLVVSSRRIASPNGSADELARQNVIQAERSVSKDEKAVRFAYGRYQMYLDLARQGGLSRLQSQEAYATWQLSQNQLAITRSVLATARIQLQQSVYKAKAPIDGVLWEIPVQSGGQVAPNQVLFKILDCRDIWVDAFVNIDDLKRIAIGSSAAVELYANGLNLQGKVRTIRFQPTGGSELGQDVAVKRPDLESNQVAQVRIELDDPQLLLHQSDSAAQFCSVGQLAQVKIFPQK